MAAPNTAVSIINDIITEHFLTSALKGDHDVTDATRKVENSIKSRRTRNSLLFLWLRMTIGVV